MNFKTREDLRSSNQQLSKHQSLAPPVVTNESHFIWKQTSLRNCRQQLDIGKEVKKSNNRDNSECTSDPLSHLNKSKNPSQPNKVVVLSHLLINNIELFVF